MIGYLLDAYTANIYNMQKRKIKDFNKKEIIMLSVLVLVGVIGITSIFIFYKNTYVHFGNMILVIMTAIIIFKIIIKDSINNYEENIKKYHKKLECLRGVLKKKEFNLYNEKKIFLLLKVCDERLSKQDTFSKLFKPLGKVFIDVILPILTFLLGVSYENLDFTMFLILSGIIIFSIFYIVGIAYMIFPFVEGALNKDRYILKSLRSELYDIYILDFSKEG